jgi:hypothetical protein
MRTVRPKKALGQHFLRDMDIAQRIAGTVDARADLPILEIGPGALEHIHGTVDYSFYETLREES